MGLPVKPDYRMYDFAGGTATVCVHYKDGKWGPKRSLALPAATTAAGKG